MGLEETLASGVKTEDGASVTDVGEAALLQEVPAVARVVTALVDKTRFDIDDAAKLTLESIDSACLDVGSNLANSSQACSQEETGDDRGGSIDSLPPASLVGMVEKRRRNVGPGGESFVELAVAVVTLVWRPPFDPCSFCVLQRIKTSSSWYLWFGITLKTRPCTMGIASSGKFGAAFLCLSSGEVPTVLGGGSGLKRSRAGAASRSYHHLSTRVRFPPLI